MLLCKCGLWSEDNETAIKHANVNLNMLSREGCIPMQTVIYYSMAFRHQEIVVVYGGDLLKVKHDSSLMQISIQHIRCDTKRRSPANVQGDLLKSQFIIIFSH